MALYVDCAYLDDIENVARIVPLAGVTTNPSIMLAAHERGQALAPLPLLHELVQISTGTVFIQPGAITEEEMFEETLAYLNVSAERVVPKIPMTHNGLVVAQRLRAMGHRIAFTAVTSISQAYCAAMTQANWIIPYYNRLQRSGTDASERITQMAKLLANQQPATRILAASIKSPSEAASALLAGAHDLTVAPQVLLAMVTDPESEQAVARFVQDWQRMKKV